MGVDRRLLDDDQFKSADETYYEIEKIEQLLKLTQSIKLEIVPGNLLDLELKDFDWELITFTVDEINIQVKFADPQIISYDQ